LALARARRAQTARTLIETTAMGLADVAFAAGFASVRQFNDTIRTVYGCTPSQLRGRRTTSAGWASRIELRLPARAPYDWPQLHAFLAVRAVPGVEQAGPNWIERSLRLPHGVGTVRLGPVTERGGTAYVACALRLGDVRDMAAAVERCRRLLDADCDPLAVDDELGADPLLAPLVRAHPGLRVPGHIAGNEVAVRAVLGQQVSVAGARTVAGRLVQRYGEALPAAVVTSEVSHLFPTAEALAEADPEELPMPRARGRALVTLCAALATGQVALDRSADREEVRRRLLALPGIGPWTADYIALRALGAPDVFLPTDVGVRHALRQHGVDPAGAEQLAGRWRPWRSYALMHLWASLAPEGGAAGPQPKTVATRPAPETAPTRKEA
jgi:AraC family transcriptional regulator of adaptative response / DNA-3-methyladenine glycosylase II